MRVYLHRLRSPFAETVTQFVKGECASILRFLIGSLQSFISLFVDRFTQSVKLGVDLYLENHNAFSEGNNQPRPQRGTRMRKQLMILPNAI